PLRVKVAKDRFAGWADRQALLQLLAPRDRDPRDFRREALYVLRLTGEEALGHEQREVGILVARRLEAPIELSLHVLPQAEAVRSNDHRAADGFEIVRQLRAANRRHVPARERLTVAGVLGRELR